MEVIVCPGMHSKLQEMIASNVTIPLYYAGLAPRTEVYARELVSTMSYAQFSGPASRHVVGDEGAVGRVTLMSEKLIR